MFGNAKIIKNLFLCKDTDYQQISGQIFRKNLIENSL